MTISWNLLNVKLKDLKKHPKNPRILTKSQGAQLTECLDKFGLIEKIIINQDMTIIGGHQRFSILKKQGIKELECWYPDRLLDDKEVEELMIRLNKNTGEFNFDMLANEFEIPDLLEYGFNPEEFLGSIDKEENDDDKPKKKKKVCPNCGEII
jgi:site-specific DNA-methyltransferase (adenine-specific)